MSEERYAIIFSSRTGNTRELADTIRGHCRTRGVRTSGGEIRRSGCRDDLCGFLDGQGHGGSGMPGAAGQASEQKIFLFGTAGFGGSEAYYQKILANVRTAIDASNTVVGEYMCQGRMPQAVRDRYVKMKEMPDAKPNLDALIENFDQALSHPDQEDLERLRRMITG